MPMRSMGQSGVLGTMGKCPSYIASSLSAKSGDSVEGRHYSPIMEGGQFGC